MAAQQGSFSNSISMRQNYVEHGVDNYYRHVAATYRNPHDEGVRGVVCTALDLWLQHTDEADERSAPGAEQSMHRFLDMAAGSGEVTEAILNWERRKLSSSACALDVSATDPFTLQAYQDRTQRTCQPLSFRDIANGGLGENEYSMVICSFALHLVSDNNELFTLLFELSTKSDWLLIIAPGKQPRIKDGWGWQRWSWKSWSADETESSELVAGRAKGRLYRSINRV